MSNRYQGLVAEASSALSSQAVPDRVLVERVRAKMGRDVSHPHAIGVESTNGQITLRGPILQDEVKGLLSAISSVRGVQEIHNLLEPHESTEHVSSLQGGVPSRGDQLDLLQDNWSPTTRLFVDAAGAALMVNCLARRTLGSALLGTLGFGMFTRSVSNRDTRQLLGVAAGREAFRFQKSMEMPASVEQVYEFVTNYESFPRFLRNVKEVRELGDGRLRWKIGLAGGADLTLDEVITEQKPCERISWQSVPGSPVAYQGTVTFEPRGDDASRVNLFLSYSLPGGALTHAVTAVLGADPESQLQDALMRIKNYFLTGKPPRDAGQSASRQRPASSS